MTRTTSSKSLIEWARNVYSQHGEDGIIEKIIQTLPEDDKWCVEFGAWDGLHLTNTRNLIESHGFSAVLIEASKKKFLDLRRNYAGKSNVIPVNCLVGFEAQNGLDTILKRTPIPRDFAVLSIDIDGNDYHVWKATEHYRPKVVVIEFNPTFPVGVDYIQPADPAINHGSSLSAIVELGSRKGYELIAVNALNAFFVIKELYPRFNLNSNTPDVLRVDTRDITYLSVGYDGTIFLNGSRKLPWHDIKLNETQLQVIPKVIRRYPGNYNFLQRCIFWLYRKRNR